MISRVKKTALAALLLLCGAALAGAQAPVKRSWYLGVQGGASFGQGTFRSITEHGFHPGLQGGLSAGYRFSRLFSLEAGVRGGGQSQYALDCCPYWLSEAGERHMTPIPGEKGWNYGDLAAATRWGKASLQANFDLLSLVTAPDSRWSLELSPQLSAVLTRTKLLAPDREIGYDPQWHFGYGGQASVGYRLTDRLALDLFGGITCLSGERFDNVPVHAHKSNFLWDGGLRLRIVLGK